ncbi:MAG: hypothetical protein HY332_18145 [Chloroflexi bacterium]|nr:hypothetical protein [Chloroflexota bacterium]
MVFGFGLALVLLALAGTLLVVGLIMLLVAPILAARFAATTSRPTLARRASGPDRMRSLIGAQISERKRRSRTSVALTRIGATLSILAVLLLAGGIAAWFAGY